MIIIGVHGTDVAMVRRLLRENDIVQDLLIIDGRTTATNETAARRMRILDVATNIAPDFDLRDFREAMRKLRVDVDLVDRKRLSYPPAPRVPQSLVVGGRSVHAALPRGKCLAWRSLKEKRRGWGLA